MFSWKHANDEVEQYGFCFPKLLGTYIGFQNKNENTPGASMPGGGCIFPSILKTDACFHFLKTCPSMFFLNQNYPFSNNHHVMRDASYNMMVAFGMENSQSKCRDREQQFSFSLSLSLSLSLDFDLVFSWGLGPSNQLEEESSLVCCWNLYDGW